MHRSAMERETRPDRGARRRPSALAMIVAGCLVMFSAAAFAEVNVSYTYDTMGRIASIVYTDGTKTTTVTYTYDASGNRTGVVTK
jgi:hypothetical protein